MYLSSRSYSRKIHKHIHREEAFCCSYRLLTRIRLIFILKQVNTKDGPLRSWKSKFHQWQYCLQPILTTDNKSVNPEIICWTPPLKQCRVNLHFLQILCWNLPNFCISHRYIYIYKYAYNVSISTVPRILFCTNKDLLLAQPKIYSLILLFDF